MPIARFRTIAKEKKRITAVKRNVDNEKHAFRRLLLNWSIGDDYKPARKIYPYDLGTVTPKSFYDQLLFLMDRGHKKDFTYLTKIFIAWIIID